MAGRALRKGVPKRCVFYDLETSFTGKWQPGMFKGKKGATRRNLIVEIGAVSVPDRYVFHRLVDPRLRHTNLKTTLETTGQNVPRTLNSWKKLFCEKQMLTRKEVTDKTHDELLERFDRLFSDRKMFSSAKTAIAEFTKFVYNGQTECPLVIAHSGCKFDHNVLRHTTMRLKLPQLDAKKMVDTIPVARRCVPGLKSYALGALHRHLFGGKDFEMQHHAMADVHATVRVMCRLARQEKVPVHALWEPPRSNDAALVSLRGVGVKTAEALRECGYDMATLRAAVMQYKVCPKAIKQRVRNHKALWKSLRKQMISAVDKRTKSKCTLNEEKPRRKPRDVLRAVHRPRSKSV